MAKKTKYPDHVVFRNEGLLCLNCGTKVTIHTPIAIDVYTKTVEGFIYAHKKCPKTWIEPKPDIGEQSAYERELFWLKNGERGISSETIFHFISGNPIRYGKGMSHPCDPDDFRRCYLLIEKTIPEWKPFLWKMKLVSPVWEKIVDNWDKLVQMLEEQMNMETSKDNGMFDFMKSLGC